MSTKKDIPDITSHKKSSHAHCLDKVGMRKMQIPISIESKEKKEIVYPAEVDILVNLTDKSVKGIHMSRLYLLACACFEKSKISRKMFDSLLEAVIDSQEGICDTSYLDLRFQYIKSSNSLLSGYKGSLYYPVEIKIIKEKKKPLRINFGLTLTYSSTCPCSAALSRQLINERIKEFFAEKPLDKETLFQWIQQEEKFLAATPHSQRSFARVSFEYAQTPDLFDFDNIIENLERVLVTTVQTVVKRSDEQEFARLNAENLMFCEDSARRLKDYFLKNKIFKNYGIKVSHEESLHAHDAVAETKSE